MTSARVLSKWLKPVNVTPVWCREFMRLGKIGG
jgi:hypothetical protein